MTSDYVAGLHDQEEPEQIDCSSGIVPAGSIVGETGECKEEQEILVPVLTSMASFFFKRYRLTMYSYLNRCLKNGTLEGAVGFHVLNRAIDRHVYNKKKVEVFFNHADEIIKMVTSSEEHLKNWNKDPEELAEA